MVDVVIRRASLQDVPDIVELLADDDLGSQREAHPGMQLASYDAAFQELYADPNQLLAVVEDSGEIIGTLQLSFIPGLSRRGAKRGQIEAVRIASHRRGEQLGEALFAWAIAECVKRNCTLVQLTTDKLRPDAQRFYERLGFRPTHVGYKLPI